MEIQIRNLRGHRYEFAKSRVILASASCQTPTR
jgi:hypothetical protein